MRAGSPAAATQGHEDVKDEPRDRTQLTGERQIPPMRLKRAALISRYSAQASSDISH